MESRGFLALVVTFAASVSLVAIAAERVSSQERNVPTTKSFPHDPAIGPDGSLWYTGMMSNTVGRLNPATGKIKEHSLKTPDSVRTD